MERSEPRFKVFSLDSDRRRALRKAVRLLTGRMLFLAALLLAGGAYLYATGQLSDLPGHFRSGGRSVDPDTPDPRIPIYSWTDENGVRRYSSVRPPEGARNVTVESGYAHDETADKRRRVDGRIKGFFLGIWRRIEGFFGGLTG